jgi:chemotaxis protein histidine kinase CheA
MADDHFSNRFAEVRARFAAKLGGKIEELNDAVPKLCGDGKDVENTITLAHRRAHDLCGIGPTIGFTETGRAARGVEKILRASLNTGHGLTAEETTKLQEAIDALRSIARVEVQLIVNGGVRA